MLSYFVAYLLCGSIIGFLAGLLGVGGGIIGIPVMVALFAQQGFPATMAVHMAIATSLATVVITSSVSSIAHYLRQAIDFRTVKYFVPGSALGGLLGAAISSTIPGIILEKIFAVFLLLISATMLWQSAREPKPVTTMPNFPRKMKIIIISLFIGVFSGMVGLGGGVVMVPYFHWAGLSMRQAVATASACIVPIAFAGAVSYSLASVQFTHPLALHSGYIYWPAFLGITMTSILFAPLGARVAHSISTNLLKKCFAGFILLIGLKMLV